MALIALLCSFPSSLVSHFSWKIAVQTAEKPCSKLFNVIPISHLSSLSVSRVISRSMTNPFRPFLSNIELFVDSVGRLNSARFSNYAACCDVDDEFSEDGEVMESLRERKPKKDGFGSLYLMEEHGLSADPNACTSLLEVCLNSGSLFDAKRVHGRILKSGLDGDGDLSNRLVSAYVGFGEFDDAAQMVGEMSKRNVVSWNHLISVFLAKKLNHQVLGLFPRTLKHTEPNQHAFARILRACSTSNVSFSCINQIHAQIFLRGFSAGPVVGNPLIYLYSKHGDADSAELVFRELCSRDSVSWVAMISAFSQNSHAEEALLLYLRMRKSRIIPTPYVFSSVLSACTKSVLFENGKQLHAQVFKWGFQFETFVGNALVTLYSRCTNLGLAEQVFAEMHHHDRITYNSLISGHAQCGNSDKVFHFYRKMQLLRLKPDAVTIASLLSSCASAGVLEKGRQLHSYVVKSGVSSDVIIEGSLLDLYVKCADVETAHKFFNTTNRENVVLWNVMLVAYGQMGNLRESFELFSQMQLARMRPNEYTYPSILRTCTSLGALDLGEQIHSQIIKTGFEQNVYVCSVLIDMYAKCGRLRAAREILERLTEEDVVSWTSMIAGYAQNEFHVEALSLFEEMQSRGIRSDNIGFSSALSACAGIQALEQGRQVHAQSVVSGFSMDLSIGNSLVTLYARCGRIKDAYSIFEMIDTKDEISWNGLISGFAQSGHCEEALQVFAKMNREGVGANLFTFGSAISASANIVEIKQGKQIHARMIKTGYDSDIEASNALITLYAKCGNIDDAKRAFYKMPQRNEVSWNAIITSYSQHGLGIEALDLFEQMKQEGFKPNHVTFVGVLSACSHVGLVNEGLDYFKSMSEKHAVLPRPEHYACVVDILGRAGILDNARQFIEDMPIEPDPMVWRTLLSACVVHKNMIIGEFAAQHLLKSDPYNPANYVLLSNLYAVARKWDLRDKMRQLMKDRGVKKEPGQSWIEIKNKVHAFFVGDRLHPLADKIYEFLEDLNKRAVAIGYVQDLFNPLHDIEQQRKDPTAYIHSEKLAVSLGLISLPPEIPILVIKNLRVCNDCHNWMKYVSLATGRSAILRDAYRFHHFEGGLCSCGDYW